jgi:hypothetical protein
MAAVFSLATCVPHVALARPAKDVLVMKNGDRITCEVKALEAGTLKVNLDYVDGTISIDWLKVARLESNYWFIVTMLDGSIYTAKLGTSSEEGAGGAKLTIQPETETERHLVDTAQVVTVTQTGESAFQRLSGNVGIGATYSKGNNATQYNFASGLAYERTRWGVLARYNSNLSSNTGAPTTTRNQLDLSGNRMLSRTNYFVGAIATFLQSSVQGIDRQTGVGVGLGRYFKNTNRVRFWVLGGAGWQSTKYSQNVSDLPAQNVGTAVFSTSLEAFTFKKTRLEIAATAFPAVKPDPGRVFYRTNATYYLKLFGKVDWNLSFYGSWDTHPPPTFAGSDYGSSTGLSYTFGNK